MLCAQLGNPLSFYGNIQLGFYNLQPYKWGAWELPYPQHYQSPLTRVEERVIEEHRGNAPEPAPIVYQSVPQENAEFIILRMEHEMRMQELAKLEPIIHKHIVPKRAKRTDDDDEALFIMM